MQAIDGAAADLIGHRLFTVMVVHHATMEVERLYSNMPEAYPVAGRKKKRNTWWGGHVVEQGRPFVGAGPADLAKAFSDHELIRSLGLNCVLNVPLRFDGLTRGTMNLLHTGEHYTPEHIGTARAIAQPSFRLKVTSAVSITMSPLSSISRRASSRARRNARTAALVSPRRRATSPIRSRVIRDRIASPER